MHISNAWTRESKIEEYFLNKYKHFCIDYFFFNLKFISEVKQMLVTL